MALFRFDDALVVTRPMDVPVDDLQLSPLERGLADGAPSDARRQEIRAGRAAAREAFAACDRALARLSVLAHPDGRPRLEPPSDWHVSIAHDGPFVAAAVAQKPIGLDVIPLGRVEQAERVVSHRLAKARAVPLADGSERPWPEPILLWTAWEALGKRSGRGVLGGAMQAHLRPRIVDAMLTADADGVRVRWWESDGALLCLAD